jgi:TonB-linked SusC/RagA family outer membrane protein
MKKIRKTTLLLLALSYFAIAYAQQKTIIRGRVIDKNDKSTIIGANVIEYDKDNRIINGTICDINGDFVLQIKDINNKIRISFMGYKTIEIKIDPAKTLTIELEPEAQTIEEVVVTGIAQRRDNLTNLDDRDKATANVRVDLRDMKESGVLSVADALQGKVSGLDILNASGDPGSGSRIVIRGLGTIGNSKPLIVIDGIPISNPPDYQNFNLASANAEDIGTLINISVQDIKSVEVLKDAGATAAYGSRGSNGVLLIETHKGRKGKVKLDYTYKKSYNFQPPAIPMLNGDEYIMLQTEEWHNRDGIYTLPAEIDYNNSNLYLRNNYIRNTDWIAAVTQNAITNDHYVNLSGGGEKATYFTSLGYIDEEGTTISTGSKTFSTRVNLDYLLSQKIFFNIHFTYSNISINDNYAPNGRNIREMAYIKAPNMSIWEYDENNKLTGEYFTPINSYQGDGMSYYNPVAVAKLGKNDRTKNYLSNSFSVRYKLAKWLTFSETVSIEITGGKNNAYLPYNAVGIDWLNWQVNKADEVNEINQVFKTMSQLYYNVPITNEKHKLSGALTWNTEQKRYEQMQIQSNKTPSVDIQDPSINAQINWIGSFLDEAKYLQGVFSINYKYDDKYLLSSTYTREAHTSFGANNRWGSFYAVSSAWRFSEESFLENLAFLGDSKIRASWGISGRQPDNSYVRFSKYGDPSTLQLFYGGYYGGQGLPKGYMDHLGVVPTQAQLSNLRWELTETFNLGLDLSLFKERFTATLDAYKKETTDILFKDYRIPTSSGYETLKQYNGGKIENFGWELMMDYHFIKKKDLLCSFNFNISQNKNTFSALPANFNYEKSSSIGNGEYPQLIVEGEPIGSFYGFRYQGVYPKDADAVAKDENGSTMYDIYGAPIPMVYNGTYVFRGGDSKYEDINHDGKIDLNDVVYIGNSNPKFYGGFGPSVKYKNFQIFCHFQYRLGYDIVNNIASKTQGMNDRNNQSKAVLRRWRAQGDDQPDMIPRAYLNNPANNLGSDRYVEKGDFLRLLNVQLNYRLGAKACEKLHLRTVSMTLSARKIATFTNYSGQDPEVSPDASNPFWMGVDNSRTPPPRIMTFALTIGF